MLETDVVVVGAGPIGIELAVALKQGGFDYLHFDAGQVGQTISWFAPQTRFFSSSERIAIAGVPLQTLDQGKATREDYLRYLRTVVDLHDLKINTFEPIRRIEREAAGGFVLTTAPLAGERRVRCRRIVLATGGTAWPRKLNVPGEDLPHVSHYFQEPHLYFRRRVLIVGGKNSAVEAALRCHNIGAEVSLCYRRSGLDPKHIKYWLMPEISGLIESGRIRAHFGMTPVEIGRGWVRLAPVDEALRPVVDGPATEIAVDVVLLLIGYEADMSLCRCAGVELEGTAQRPRHDPRTMETNVPGVYVAGTAVGGTQEKYRVFIENCHVHVERIINALRGQVVDAPEPQYTRPES
jgi:thioredoxin reductase (NADPH)